ncbi:hypothetical protein [Streptomyces rochei]|uniref:hypothetical protein n=1 Tax=Streptomyces rochei TaxID=1928 RepID=UPI0036876E04
MQRRRKARQQSNYQVDSVHQVFGDNALLYISDALFDGDMMSITAVDRETRSTGASWSFPIPAERIPPDLSPDELAAYKDKLRRIRLTALRAAGLATGSTEESEPDYQDLTTAEREQLALETASLVSDTLARLFLRLGPPPAGTGRDFNPVTSGGGGATQ